MVFNSLHFLWFFLVVYAVYRVLPHRGAELAAARRQLLLLRLLGLALPLAAPRRSTVVDYSCGRALDATDDPRRRKLLLCLSLGFNLTLLGFFKYFNFFADNLHVAVRCARLAAGLRHPAGAAADRDLVLHVRDDELRDRRLSPRDSGRRAILSTSRCSSRTSRTSSPGRSCAPRRCCRRSTSRGGSAPSRCATARG